MSAVNAQADLTVVILTYNEEKHIRRVMESAWTFAKAVVIIDSYSTDKTIQIAKELNAQVLQNPFVNHAHQLQWGLESGAIKTSWTMRLDADEYVTPDLVKEILTRLPLMATDISGVELKRRVHFMGQWIRHGGYYPVKLLRIWRTGHAFMEQRWMDEHIILKKGTSIVFQNDFVDDNLNSMSWWTSKHNDYATREAVDILNKKYQFIKEGQIDGKIPNTKQAKLKRWYKNNLYLRLPLFFRCFLYFQFRFWLKLGFLDGKKGLVWHFLQSFWYRFLVDAKIMQIEWWAIQENKSVKDIIEEKFNVSLEAVSRYVAGNEENSILETEESSG